MADRGRPAKRGEEFPRFGARAKGVIVIGRGGTGIIDMV
jgi:hypothetical protein